MGEGVQPECDKLGGGEEGGEEDEEGEGVFLEVCVFSYGKGGVVSLSLSLSLSRVSS